MEFTIISFFSKVLYHNKTKFPKTVIDSYIYRNIIKELTLFKRIILIVLINIKEII